MGGGSESSSNYFQSEVVLLYMCYSVIISNYAMLMLYICLLFRLYSLVLTTFMPCEKVLLDSEITLTHMVPLLLMGCPLFWSVLLSFSSYCGLLG